MICWKCKIAILWKKWQFLSSIRNLVIIDTILRINKVDLEIEDNSELLIAKNLNEYVKSKIIDGDMYYVILDEIQKVENFEAVLNGFLKDSLESVWYYKKIWLNKTIEKVWR